MANDFNDTLNDRPTGEDFSLCQKVTAGLMEENRGRKKGIPNSRKITEQELKFLLNALYANGKKREHLLLLLAVNTPLDIKNIVKLQIKHFTAYGSFKGTIDIEDTEKVKREIYLGVDVSNYVLDYLYDTDYVCDLKNPEEYIFKKDTKKFKVKEDGSPISSNAVIQTVNSFISEKLTLMPEFGELRLNCGMLKDIFNENYMRYLEKMINTVKYEGNLVGTKIENFGKNK